MLLIFNRELLASRLRPFALLGFDSPVRRL
jgi:hypothetical protein